MACWISTPGWAMLASSARVKGLLVPASPSSAVWPGPVAKASSVPSPDFISARPSADVGAAGRLGRTDFRRERVVAAGIQEHQLDLGIAHGLFEREVDVDRGAELDVHLGFEVGVDGQQIVGAVHRDAVAGIEEQRDIGAFRLLAEVEQLFGHLVAGEVGALDHLEADIAEHPGHRLGVDGGIGQRRHVLVGAVADDEGDALVGEGIRVGADEKSCGGQCCDQEAHLRSPLTQTGGQRGPIHWETI